MSVRAAVMPAPGQPVEVRTYPDPTLEPGAILLKTLAAEVCGTDVHLWHGRLAGVPYPLIPGHVSVGEVIVTGGTVHDIEGVPVRSGDAVTFLDVHGTCHNCWYCLVAKASTRCPHRRVYGITYGAEDAPGLLGGWSEQIYLKPGVKVVRLRGTVTPERWIAGGCGLPTALHAIDLSAIRLADRVLIQGAGPVGLNACALAVASGAAWVGVIDPVPLRQEMARAMGAAAVFTPAEAEAAVKAATGGRGADVVIEASGVPAAVPQGCLLARDGGRYILVGQYTDNGEIALNPHLAINKKHLTVQGCWGSDFSHVWRAMETLDRLGDRFPWAQLISRRYTLDETPAALADVEARRVVKAMIVP